MPTNYDLTQSQSDMEIDHHPGSHKKNVFENVFLQSCIITNEESSLAPDYLLKSIDLKHLQLRNYLLCTLYLCAQPQINTKSYICNHFILKIMPAIHRLSD